MSAATQQTLTNQQDRLHSNGLEGEVACRHCPCAGRRTPHRHPLLSQRDAWLGGSENCPRAGKRIQLLHPLPVATSSIAISIEMIVPLLGNVTSSVASLCREMPRMSSTRHWQEFLFKLPVPLRRHQGTDRATPKKCPAVQARTASTVPETVSQMSPTVPFQLRQLHARNSKTALEDMS